MKKSVKSLHTATGPWLNFPNMDRLISPEVIFTKKFIKVYKEGVVGDGVGIREFSVQGLGIADFLWVEKNRQSPKIIAFELKLKNWKRGIAQAYRYSYFSDESYLVVPDSLTDTIFKHLPYFREMNIGLIGFNEDTSKYIVHLSPRKKRYFSEVARFRALKNLVTGYDLGFLTKYGDSLSQSLQVSPP